jgi:translation initiation factor 2-alpha kinase 4
MAWKKPTNQPKKSDAGFPGLKSHRGSTTKYEELQQNELIALDAIYGEDFKRLKEAHSAWKV